MIIETFDIFEDALLFIENQEYDSEEYFKAEIYRTQDGRWRVGVSFEPQLEFKFG